MFRLSIFGLLLLSNGALGNKILKECFSGKTVLNHCKCEVLTRVYSVSEGKLTCADGQALETANKVHELLGDSLLILELHISSLSSPYLSYKDLTSFPRLLTLSVSHSNLNFIEPTTFKDLAGLETLDLTHNKFKVISSDTLKFLVSLKNLSLANNHIASIENDSFLHMTGLLHLDLSGNNLRQIRSDWFSELKSLMSLSLANNEIFSIKPDSLQHLISLQQLDVSGNRLKTLLHNVFLHLKNIRSLSIASNNLQTLNENTFKGNKLLEKINLTGNAWVCDKRLLPLSDWLKMHEMDKAYCAEPVEFSNLTLQTGLLVVHLEIEVEESPICNASMCNCTVSNDKQIVKIDCVGRQFTKLPESLPYKTRVLDLRNNAIRSLTMDHVNATQWADVTFLHLNNNLINSLKGLEGTWLLRNLVALHLTNNQLTEIPIHILEQFRGGLLDELYLSGNPWNCDCNTVRFQTWLQDNYKTIKDFDGIRCSSASGVYSNQPIFHLFKSQLCPQHIQLVNYLDVLNGFMAVAIVLIIMKLSFDFWLQKRTGKLPRFFSLNMSQ